MKCLAYFDWKTEWTPLHIFRTLFLGHLPVLLLFRIRRTKNVATTTFLNAADVSSALLRSATVPPRTSVEIPTKVNYI